MAASLKHGSDTVDTYLQSLEDKHRMVSDEIDEILKRPYVSNDVSDLKKKKLKLKERIFALTS